ncbi:MAG: 16S rRNA (guanine(966)-N(2))-methyltransferase RsmD [Gammaproteobacteria bacterium HGW-Gammaproteobacteria-8]|nr:MAG: 16S rRNA (guanine(966)-N(2))-methyltransferase RsmD [Gammaproteobacteria bacterium HGW-Gammaproteobacteria-8]
MSGKVRIIGGRWRGRRLEVPDLPGLRPSGDRGRETLFNWLQHRIHGARCLDLFAGTGALGLEAVSRGAARVTLVERDRSLCDALRQIRAGWPGGERLELVQADVRHWLETAAGPFDLVFLDPPFDAGLYGASLDALARPGLLTPGAWIYVESDARSAAPIAAQEAVECASAPCLAADFETTPRWSVRREKCLGEVRMQLLEAAPDDTGH